MHAKSESVVRRRVVCPECGIDFTITWDRDLHRAEPEAHFCPDDDCGFVGHRGEFPRAVRMGD